MTRPPYLVDEVPVQPHKPPPAASVPTWTRGAGLVCAAYVAGVHLGLCDETYKQAAYLGAAFVAGALLLIIGASIASAGRRFGRLAPTLAWVCNGVVMAAALLAFVFSRTTGLPSYHHSDWPVIQVIALVAEVGYLVLTAVALSRISGRGAGAAS